MSQVLHVTHGHVSCESVQERACESVQFLLPKAPSLCSDEVLWQHALLGMLTPACCGISEMQPAIPPETTATFHESRCGQQAGSACCGPSHPL